jgi:hypothetical protein
MPLHGVVKKIASIVTVIVVEAAWLFRMVVNDRITGSTCRKYALLMVDGVTRTSLFSPRARKFRQPSGNLKDLLTAFDTAKKVMRHTRQAHYGAW